uniref:phosphoethanolamine N-methyltransferase n=1 Tax=Eptatretus burgeri TaxID=7764 RepID=A0A8C4NBV5_EPTBU
MRDFPENTFDVVYSQDAILYTMDKFSLFQKFHRWLKPTGRFIMCDFCCGEKPWSEEFQKFADQSGYILWTLSAMAKSLQDAGFAEVHVTDLNQEMVKSMNNYLKYFNDNQAEFVKNFSQAEYDDFVRIWKFREMALEANYYSWGLFEGKKNLL